MLEFSNNIILAELYTAQVDACVVLKILYRYLKVANIKLYRRVSFSVKESYFVEILAVSEQEFESY
jgi:hypothetical protein